MSQRKREKWDQAGKRKTMTFTDQHGREWTGVKDIFTDTPIGPLNPQGWQPVTYHGRELLPDAKYFRFDDKRPGKFEIDYPAWRADIVAAMGQWMQQAGSYAAAMYGDKAMDALDNPTPALLNVLGPKPMPVDLIEAMIEGNRWILGLSDKKPTWADEFFTEKVVVPGERRFVDVEDDLAIAGPKREPGTGRFVPKEE